MIALEREQRPTLERTIVRRCIVALNRLPDVKAVRNNTGKSPCACRACVPKLCRHCQRRLVYPISFGLGEGGPDIVGLFRFRMPRGPINSAFGIEVKRPDRRTAHKEVRVKQGAWRAAAAGWGMFCAEVTSEDEAVMVVEGFRVQVLARVVA